MARQDIPLEAVDGFEPQYVDKLAASWVTTADQLVAIAATPNGLADLASSLEISATKMAELVDLARTALPASTVSRLERPLNTSSFSLGARLTPKR